MRVHMLALVVLSTIATGCGSRTTDVSRSLTIATGSSNALYFQFGRGLAEVLSATVPGISVRAEATNASPFNVDAVERGQADLALAMGDTTYQAFRRGTEAFPAPHTHLRGIAVLYPNVLHIVVRADSDLHSVAELGGRQVAYVMAQRRESNIRHDMIEAIARAHGVDPSTVRQRYARLEDVVVGLENRTLDAAFVWMGYPTPVLAQAATSVGVRFLPLPARTIEILRNQYPFWHPVVLPAAAYAGQDREVAGVAMDNLLVCREDLPEDLVYRLTSALFASLGRLGARFPVARQIDPDRAPLLPIPVHAGAARYYRERELQRW
jgi:uncharacterized protein